MLAKGAVGLMLHANVLSQLHARTTMNKMIKSALMAGSLVAASVSHGFAQSAPVDTTAAPAPIITPDDWNYEATVYGWLSAIGGETSAGDSIDISFSDILEDLQMTFMGGILAQKGKFSLFSDLIYLSMGSTEKTTANVIGMPVKVKADINIKNWINTSGVAYALVDNGKTTLAGLAGVRYLKLKADIDFEVGPLGRSVSENKDFFDGIVGIRGKTDLSDDWYMTYYADIGTGQSDLTYQLFAGLNYRFKKWDAVVGYRYMGWDLGNSGLIKDLTVSGPLIGARFRF